MAKRVSQSAQACLDYVARSGCIKIASFKIARLKSPGLESPCHADVARLESQPLVKSLGIDPAVMGQQLDQLAAAGARFRDRPLHQLLTDAAAAATAGDANILDQGACGALRTQSRQDAKLQAADHGAGAILGHHQPNIK